MFVLKTYGKWGGTYTFYMFGDRTCMYTAAYDSDDTASVYRYYVFISRSDMFGYLYEVYNAVLTGEKLAVEPVPIRRNN